MKFILKVTTAYFTCPGFMFRLRVYPQKVIRINRFIGESKRASDGEPAEAGKYWMIYSETRSFL